MAGLNDVFPVERKQDTLIVAPRGDAFSFRETDIGGELKSLLDEIDQSEETNLVIDLGSSEYFGTVIIGAVVELGQKAAAKGGRVAFCSSSTQTLRVLEVFKLDSLWPHYETRRQALKAVK